MRSCLCLEGYARSIAVGLTACSVNWSTCGRRSIQLSRSVTGASEQTHKSYMYTVTAKIYGLPQQCDTASL